MSDNISGLTVAVRSSELSARILKCLENIIDLSLVTVSDEVFFGVPRKYGRDSVNIVFADIALLENAGRERIDETRRREGPFFIVAVGSREYEQLYTAMTCGADDYIHPGMSDEEITELCGRAVSHLAENDLAARNAVKRLFCQRQFLRLLPDMSIETVNAHYGTAFCSGCFRMIFLKFDCYERAYRLEEILDPIRDKIKDEITNVFSAICYEVMTDDKFDGAIGLLNYPEEEDERFHTLVKQLQIRVQHLMGDNVWLPVTVCISGAHYRLDETEEAIDQVMEAGWMRITKGIGGISYWDKADTDIPVLLRKRVDDILAGIRETCDTLNVDSFRKKVDELCSLPGGVSIVRSKAVNRFIDKLLENLAESLAGELSAKAISHSLIMATSIEEYCEILKSRVSSILQNRINNMQIRYSLPVRLALEYVEKNLTERLTLEGAAENAHINPSYLSTLFSRETGQTFSNYIMLRRISEAKLHLRKGNMNVSEAAAAVGITDYKYFSRLFKRYVGISPREYRLIYNRKTE